MKNLILMTAILFSQISLAKNASQPPPWAEELMGVALQQRTLLSFTWTTIKPPSAPGAKDGDSSMINKIETTIAKQSADNKKFSFDIVIHQIMENSKKPLTRPDLVCAQVELTSTQAEPDSYTEVVEVRPNLWAVIVYSAGPCK